MGSYDPKGMGHPWISAWGKTSPSPLFRQGRRPQARPGVDVVKETYLRGLRWVMPLLLAAAGSVFAADPQHPTVSAATTSPTCLQCHDGVLAPNITPPTLTPMGTVPAGRRTGDHPVGVDYLAAQAFRWAGLRPVGLLPPEIRLVDGRVECSSCHDLSSSGPPRLAVAMAGSRLCFACHDL